MIRVQDFEVILKRSRRVFRDLIADELRFCCIRWSSLVQKIRYIGLLIEARQFRKNAYCNVGRSFIKQPVETV